MKKTHFFIKGVLLFLWILIFLFIIFLFISKNNSLPLSEKYLLEEEFEETSLNEEGFIDTSLNQLSGEIRSIEEIPGGKKISLAVTLPIATDSFLPEDYEKFAPENFPTEENVWLFSVANDKENGVIFSEGQSIIISFYGEPSKEEYREGEFIEIFE